MPIIPSQKRGISDSIASIYDIASIEGIPINFEEFTHRIVITQSNANERKSGSVRHLADGDMSLTQSQE